MGAPPRAWRHTTPPGRRRSELQRHWQMLPAVDASTVTLSAAQLQPRRRRRRRWWWSREHLAEATGAPVRRRQRGVHGCSRGARQRRGSLAVLPWRRAARRGGVCGLVRPVPCWCTGINEPARAASAAAEARRTPQFGETVRQQRSDGTGRVVTR